MTTETCTFSALIDEVKLRSQRRDRIADIVSYARSTIRECQVLAHFEQDLVEDQITVDAVPYLWTRPLRLRAMLAVKPNGLFDRRSNPIWFANKPPGEYRFGDEYFYYLSGSTFIFAGDLLATSQVIDMAYFTYARKFVYYEAVADRPATFDPETELWSYAAAYDVDEITRAAGRELVSNWLLELWYDSILEGTLAKIFKAVGDQRSKMSFSLYKSQQKDIEHGERTIAVNDHDGNG